MMRAEEALASLPENPPPFPESRSALRRLLILAVLMEFGFLALWRIGNWNNQIPLFLGVYFFAFLLYGIAVKLTLNARFSKIPRIGVYIFFFAILFRLTVLPVIPSISEDIYRYIWDGRNQVAGFGPYDYAPQAPQLQKQRDQYYPRINHKDVRTPYAAGSETIFHWLAELSPHVLVYKSAFLLFDLLLIETIRRLLNKEGLSASMLLIYAWHPMPVIEFAGAGHMDITGISLLFLSYLMVMNSQEIAGGALFAMAAFTKYLPVAGLPWLLKKGGWKFLLVAMLVSAALIYQYYTPDLRMLKGVFAFYEKWWFNDSLFGVLYKWLGGAGPARMWGIFFVSLTAIFCLAAGYSFYDSLFFIFCAVILFSSVVHPWYLCWIIPFLCFRPSRPWLFFTGWIAVSYLIRFLFPNGVWGQVLWLKLLVYVPFYTLFFISILNPRWHPAPVRVNKSVLQHLPRK